MSLLCISTYQSLRYDPATNHEQRYCWTSKNPPIDWIVVHQHKPMYSTNTDKAQAEKLRDLYHQLFQRYDVDLVISGHNQYYESTFPILYNETDQWTSNSFDIPDPIIATDHRSEYLPTNGIVFLSGCTAGDKLHPVRETHDNHVIQKVNMDFSIWNCPLKAKYSRVNFIIMMHRS